MGTSWNYKDLTGQRFGKLLVTQRTDRRDKSGGIIWECRCDCGSTVLIRSTALLQGLKTDCGCVKAEKKAQREAIREAARKARAEENARLRAEKKAQKEAEAQAREQRARERERERERKKAEKELARKAKDILEANERVTKTEEELWQEKMAEYTRWGMTGTLCWNCIRSAAPPSLQCIWDESKGQQLPEGAVTQHDANSIGYPTIVTSCPEFLPLYERKNALLLEQEREKNTQEFANEIYEKVNASIKRARL